jgi:hypothetical protein
MDMAAVSYHPVYAYDNVHQLLFTGGNLCYCKDGGILNYNNLKLHKGVDNELIFRVLDPNRTPVDMSCDYQIYGRIIDTDTGVIVLEKLCRLGPAKGIIKFIVDAGDFESVPSGMYSMVLIASKPFVTGSLDQFTDHALYSDMNNNVAMDLEITEQAFRGPLPEIVYTPSDWTGDIIVPVNGPPVPGFYTGRIPGARVQNHRSSVHTFSTYTTAFTGTLYIWGTLSESPDPYLSKNRWFKIYPSASAQDIQYTKYTGTQAWSFTADVMWLQFGYVPSLSTKTPGTLNKLIIRA